MKFYHGSTVKGLTELRPDYAVNAYIKDPLVYLTTSRQLALHYIWDVKRLGKIKMPMIDIRSDGTIVFQEMFPNALEYLYKGVDGYIYECDGDCSLNSETHINTCATSNKVVPITSFEYIEDVYEHILSYSENGKFVYERYEDLPQWRKDIIRGHITRFIKHHNLLDDPDHPSLEFIRKKFPRYWEEALILNKYNLL